MLHVPRVKICGITNDEDAAMAIAYGADALGFLVGLLYHSEDELSPAAARKIVAALPPFVSAVLVTHRSELAEVRDLCRVVAPAVVQLHGDFALADLPPLRDEFPQMRIVKTVHVHEGATVQVEELHPGQVDAVLLDTWTPTRLGGTGITHDWSISRRIGDMLPHTPVILAGGLTPDNVAAAIAAVQPYGVDVNSGVSAMRGKKAPPLVAEFIRAAKRAAFERRLS